MLTHGPGDSVPVHSLFDEHVWVGDETGVQGGFTNNMVGFEQRISILLAWYKNLTDGG